MLRRCLLRRRAALHATFERFEATQQLLHRHARLLATQREQRDLEHGAAVLREQTHPLARVQQLLEPDREPRVADLARALDHARPRGERLLEVRRVGAAVRGEQRVAQVDEQRVEQLALTAFLRRQRAQEAGAIGVEDAVDDAFELLQRAGAREPREVGERGSIADEREQLVRHRQRVAHTAARAPRELQRDALFRFDLFEPEDLGEARRDRRFGQRRELQHLATRQDRVEHLVRLGRREEELHVRGRLLERLQERVEGRLREHVHFIDDVHLEARAHRVVGDLVTQLAHVLDARVRRGVDLDHVDVRTGVDVLAVHTLAARVGSGAALADQRLREDARGRRLARPARPAEEVSVADAFALDRAAQGAGQDILTGDLLEGARPILASQDEVRHGTDESSSRRACSIVVQSELGRRAPGGGPGHHTHGPTSLGLLRSRPDPVRK